MLLENEMEAGFRVFQLKDSLVLDLLEKFLGTLRDEIKKAA